MIFLERSLERSEFLSWGREETTQHSGYLISNLCDGVIDTGSNATENVVVWNLSRSRNRSSAGWTAPNSRTCSRSANRRCWYWCSLCIIIRHWNGSAENNQKAQNCTKNGIISHFRDTLQTIDSKLIFSEIPRFRCQKKCFIKKWVFRKEMSFSSKKNDCRRQKSSGEKKIWQNKRCEFEEQFVAPLNQRYGSFKKWKSFTVVPNETVSGFYAKNSWRNLSFNRPMVYNHQCIMTNGISITSLFVDPCHDHRTVVKSVKIFCHVDRNNSLALFFFIILHFLFAFHFFFLNFFFFSFFVIVRCSFWMPIIVPPPLIFIPIISADKSPYCVEQIMANGMYLIIHWLLNGLLLRKPNKNKCYFCMLTAGAQRCSVRCCQKTSRKGEMVGALPLCNEKYGVWPRFLAQCSLYNL